MTNKTREKLAALLATYGVKLDEARQVADEIHVVNQTAHFIGRVTSGQEQPKVTGIDRINVARLLEPTEHFGGISDPLSRTQAACETLRMYIAETSTSKWSAWVGIMMYVGDSQLAAAEWLRDHGYFEDKSTLN